MVKFPSPEWWFTSSGVISTSLYDCCCCTCRISFYSRDACSSRGDDCISNHQLLLVGASSTRRLDGTQQLWLLPQPRSVSGSTPRGQVLHQTGAVQCIQRYVSEQATEQYSVNAKHTSALLEIIHRLVSSIRTLGTLLLLLIHVAMTVVLITSAPSKRCAVQLPGRQGAVASSVLGSVSAYYSRQCRTARQCIAAEMRDETTDCSSCCRRRRFAPRRLYATRIHIF